MVEHVSIHYHLAKNQGLRDAKGTFEDWDITIPGDAVAGDTVLVTNMPFEILYSQQTAVCTDVPMTGLTVDVGIRQNDAEEGSEPFEDLTFFASAVDMTAVAAVYDMAVPASPRDAEGRLFEHDVIVTLKGTVATHRGKTFHFVPVFRVDGEPA